jgi:hypothetical protein
MTKDQPADVPEDEEPVDLDLDDLDDSLRDERLGKATTVRIDGAIIHVLHAGDWSSSAMRAAGIGDWDTWAEQVIPDPEEFKLWDAADLRNYQIEAIFQECGRKARMTMGKSRRSGGSRPRSRRK